MPTKLLVWNIQNFTLKKIDWTVGEEVSVFYPGTTTPKFFSAYNTLRNDYILSNVEATNPDIFIVIEVISGWGAKGSLVSSGGASGVTALLERLRRINFNWCLVPPLKLTDQIQVNEYEENGNDLQELLKEGGYTEAIAVFYRKDNLDFIGPYIWPTVPDNSDAAKKAVPNGTATAGAYPGAWSGCMPATNFYAGQFEFKGLNGLGKEFELLFPDQGSRRPFFTKFLEKNGQKRIISVASLHLPPNSNSAMAALGRVVEYFAKYYQQADNEVLLIAGDYNINPFVDYYNLTFTLEQGKFKAMLDRDPARNSTMNYTNAWAKPTAYLKKDVILDNIAYRYGGNAAIDGPNGIAVIDRVSFQSILYNSMQEIMAQPTVDAQNELFRSPLNFKKIGPNPGTSDHLALYVQI